MQALDQLDEDDVFLLVIVIRVVFYLELGQLVGYDFSPRTPWDIRLQLRQNRKLQQPQL